MTTPICACGCGKHTRLPKHSYIAYHHMRNRTLPLEVRLKISKSGIGRHHSDETKLRLSQIRKGMKFNDMWKRHLSEAHKGKRLSDEQRRHISAALKGRVFSPKHRYNLSIVNTGKKWNLERRIKQSNRLKGKVPKCARNERSLELKNKLRIATLNYIRRYRESYKPNLGPYEKHILDKLEALIKLPIIRNKYINGYFVDGYVYSKNMVIEIDEPRHYHTDGTLRKQDILREEKIYETLGCVIIRIPDIHIRNGCTDEELTCVLEKHTDNYW